MAAEIHQCLYLALPLLGLERYLPMPKTVCLKATFSSCCLLCPFSQILDTYLRFLRVCFTTRRFGMVPAFQPEYCSSTSDVSVTCNRINCIRMIISRSINSRQQSHCALSGQPKRGAPQRQITTTTKFPLILNVSLFTNIPFGRCAQQKYSFNLPDSIA